MKKSGLSLLWILLMAILISAVLADPPIGEPPFYKYPFVYDPYFDVPDNSYLALGPGQPNPPRGSTYPDGNWYSAYWGHISPESYARVEDGMCRLKTVSIDHSPWVFGGTMVNQGRASHLAVQLGHFKGSNTTYLDANPTPRIIFNYGETIPSGTLWLFVRARILNRAKMNYENPMAQANLGFNFQFQPEYRDGSGNVVLEDYDNPDFQAGMGVFPKVVNFDIFLSNHVYDWISGEYEQAVGHENRQINYLPGILPDADLHVQRVEGQMLNKNTWYTFNIDLGYNINRALQMTEDHYYSLFGDPYPPHGWYTLNRLILRNIQLYTEASGGLIEAQVDSVYIYTGSPACLSISASLSGTTDPAPGTYAYPHGYSVTVTASPYSNYTFIAWDLDGTITYENPITVTMNSDHTLEAYFRGKFPPSDVNDDGIVFVQDIGMAARAFGSWPGHPRWNPIADITGRTPLVPDGIVDIKDITRIARDFGKHYPPDPPDATTIVSVYPSEITVCEGETFSVDVTVTNVTDLYGYAFELYYNASVLNCTGVEFPSGHFLEPTLNYSNIFIVRQEYNNTYDPTHGSVWVAAGLLADEPGKNGSGTLARISFKATAEGNSTLDLQGTGLIDTMVEDISISVVNGTVTVLPPPVCALKTTIDGSFYVPNVATSFLKVEMLFNNSNLVGDQVGGTSPYPTIARYPDGMVEINDVTFIARLIGSIEGSSNWDYMADVVPDHIIYVQDITAAAKNFGKYGNYIYNLSGVTVKFDTGLEISPDQYGYVQIPQGATSFNVTRYGNPIGAMIIFW